MEITVFYSAKNTEPENCDGLNWSAFCDFMLDLTLDWQYRARQAIMQRPKVGCQQARSRAY